VATLTGIGGALAVALLGYLFFALLYPERLG
jgi:K+-transporting ATPase KdpF subunit